MATLVLTTVGSALGGSVGAALGGLIGQSIDRGLFGPGANKGPRLGDVAVQTSSYGSQIPQIYGKMRVAGTVVWATDLIEKESIQGGGKGSRERSAYHYSANLAVALSSRPIQSVRRIWADGKLIRRANGEFKVKTKFRLALGTEDQPQDPLIASVEGLGTAPAYRGLALAIFEDLELGEFGNRIPLLTFEVIGDAEPLTTGELLAEVSDGIIEISGGTKLTGFAAHGPSLRECIALLVELGDVMLVDSGGRLVSPPGNGPLQISDEELGCDADRPGCAKMDRSREPECKMPAILTLTFYDPDRDYQAGQTRASSGMRGTGETRLELPAVIAASEARKMGEQALARKWHAREMLKLRLPPSHLGLKPGDALQLPDSPRIWIARSVSIEGMAVGVEAQAAPTAIQALPASSGRSVVEPDTGIGRSRVALLEIPSDGDAIADCPTVLLAASSEGDWRNLPVELSLANQPLMSVAVSRRSTIGSTETLLGHLAPWVVDDRSDVIVRLANSKDVLLHADLDALAAGANLALIGEELIQFGRAEQLGTGLFRLSKLLRGRRGTEWAAATHALGEPFCMIETSRLVPLRLPAGGVGATLSAVAHGVGDVAPLPEVRRIVSSETMRPPAPCHLRAERSGDDVHLRWVRRSHRHWAWLDGVGDGEDGYAESYRISLEGPGGATQLESSASSIQLSPADIPGHAGQVLVVSVATIGPTAMSHAAQLTFTL